MIVHTYRLIVYSTSKNVQGHYRLPGECVDQEIKNTDHKDNGRVVESFENYFRVNKICNIFGQKDFHVNVSIKDILCGKTGS